MHTMHTPPRLRLEPRPSHVACAWIVGVGAAALALLAVLSLPPTASAIGGASVVVVVGRGLWRCTGRRVPALLHVGIDRRISVGDRAGGSLAGPILDDTYVGAMLTAVVWRDDGDPWWQPARTFLVLPDTLPPDDRRRLRVVLRHGRAAGADATSAADAA